MKRMCSAVIALVLLCFGIPSISASAENYDHLTEGIYYIDATLSCYINAMGGVEFGEPLLASSQIEVSADGSKTMTLYLTKSRVTIYGVTCDTFIDVSPSYVTETNGVQSGTLGYYDANGVLVTDRVTYTLSEDTAENARQEQIHYVDSVSFPIEYESDTYNLSVFVNSNVMGTQFTKDGYPAILTVDWSTVSAEKVPEKEDNEMTNDDTEATDQENVDRKDGLNIYHANTGETAADVGTAVSGTYAAYFREPVLIVVGVTAGVMILIGVVLIFAGRKEKKL